MKFFNFKRSYPKLYTDLIKKQDVNAIYENLTDMDVEKNVIERVRLKAKTFGQDITSYGLNTGNVLEFEKLLSSF